MQCRRAYIENWRVQAETNNDVTAAVQGNYSNFEQKLVEKESFVISIVNGGQLLSGKFCLRATKPETEIFPESCIFWTNILGKLTKKIFGATPSPHERS